MPPIAIVVGLILLAIGGGGYAAAEVKSPTALIPAAIGGVLLLLGLIGLAGDAARKHSMHLAAMIGLFGAIGGWMPVIRQMKNKGAVDFTSLPVLSGLGMSVLCLIFVGLCVNSFIQARRARRAREASGTETAA